MPNLYSNEDCIDKYTIKKNNIDFIPKVSVIIPVFNVEGYLRQCLESVVNQTLKNIEIICVDDGSTDNSLSILKEYAEKDNRLTLVSLLFTARQSLCKWLKNVQHSRGRMMPKTHVGDH